MAGRVVWGGCSHLREGCGQVVGARGDPTSCRRPPGGGARDGVGRRASVHRRRSTKVVPEGKHAGVVCELVVPA